jgi:D-lactate dehydrogenase
VLAWALDTQILAAAGIDTIEGEEFLQREEELLSAADVEEQLRLLVSNHLLQRRPNVILTPHMAFNS